MTQTASQATAPAADAAAGQLSGRRAGWVLAWLAFVPLAVFRAGVLSEADTFWQIRTGLLTIANHAIPATDTFSWTMHGKPYFQNSWGFNVVLAVAYRVGGLPGVAWLCSMIILMIVALALALARGLGGSPGVSAAILFVAAAPLTGWLTARPQLVDYAAVAALILLLRRLEQGRNRWGAVALTGLLTVVWVNLHAAALLAIGIAGGGAAVLLLTRRGVSWRYVAAAAAVAAAGCLVNPYGVGVLTQAGQVQSASDGLITEWLPLRWTNPLQDVALAAGVVALVAAWRRREAVLVAGLAICLPGAVAAQRMLPFVVLLATPVLAAELSDPPAVIARYLTSRRAMFRLGAVVALIGLAAVAAPSLSHIGRPEPSTYPVDLVGDIPHGCRLFTTDLIGGYVILARPDVLVSLDTRNNLYGRKVLLAEERVLHGYGNPATGLAGAGCVLVPRSYGLTRQLRDDAQWRVREADRIAILYVRA